MNGSLKNEAVLKQLEEREITTDEIENQLSQFARGNISLELLKPATIGDGVVKLNQEDEKKYIEIYENSYPSLRVVKFVPASGAASRMFKDLLSEYEKIKEVDNPEADKYKYSKELIDNFSRFAFYDDLKSACNINDLKEILETLLFDPGLNYSNLPKGLIKFHREGNITKTAFEEQLVEAAEYTRDKAGVCNLHFTVPAEYKTRIEQFLNGKLSIYEEENIYFDLSYSIQNPSTDTIAVDSNDNPVMDNKGNLVFRPAGHGALIENLDAIDADIVFIKNIDNVSTDKYLPDTIKYKKVIGGYLVSVCKKIREILLALDNEKLDEGLKKEAREFCRDRIGVVIPEVFDPELIKGLLNRPVRVCGVVKNEGEPGGGPFWVSREGNKSKQIVESAQVDMEDLKQKEIWNSSTHFNPVDLACSVRDYRGNKFNLDGYIDRDAGIITNKSIDGQDIKALELPGLWNGAMAEWITVFIEVPLITFNPVKTVFDLLRKEHQS